MATVAYKLKLSAKEFAYYDDAATREHHLRRVVWLSAPDPVYSCGEKVAKHSVMQMLQQSNQYLADGLYGGRAIGELAPIPYRNDL